MDVLIPTAPQWIDAFEKAGVDSRTGDIVRPSLVVFVGVATKAHAISVGWSSLAEMRPMVSGWSGTGPIGFEETGLCGETPQGL